MTNTQVQVPARASTVAEFRQVHLSDYKKKLLKIQKPRKLYTIKDPKKFSLQRAKNSSAQQSYQSNWNSSANSKKKLLKIQK